MNIKDAHIAELRKQRDALQVENDKLKKRLAAWPGRAAEHARKARDSERRRLVA